MMPRAPKVTVKEESPKPYTPYSKKVVKVSGKDVERVGVEAFVFISLSSWQVRNTSANFKRRHDQANALDDLLTPHRQWKASIPGLAKSGSETSWRTCGNL